jgi:proline iminopeptidase
VEDLEALRQHLGLDRIVLLGASYGGMLALSYAVRYPQNVSHLIAVATVPSYRFLDRAKEILADRGTPEQQALAARLFDGNLENDDQLREYRMVLGPLYARKFDPDRARERSKLNIPSYEASNQGFGGYLRSFDVTDQLGAINIPTLVVGARHDWVCAPEFSEEIARKIPNADLRIFENSGHQILVDELPAFIDVVRGFLTYKV